MQGPAKRVERATELWFRERQRPGLELGLAVDEVLLLKRSRFQEIAVVQTREYGRLLALDGMVMTTEADEFIYHEMMVHPAMNCHPHPSRVLVIGGGDGGAIREVVRHRELERAVLCEIDPEVVEASRRFLPGLACGLDHPAVEVVHQDGLRYLEGRRGAFDLILVDSPDPVGPALSLYCREFYGLCLQALAEEGILVVQSESPVLHREIIQSVAGAMAAAGFPTVHFYWAVVPTYPGAMWCWAMASKGPHPLEGFREERCRRMEGELRYYNRRVHRAAFALPTFFRRMVEEATTRR